MKKELEDILAWYCPNINESTINAELYHQCKINNIEIYLEQKVKNIEGRLDAILVINENIIIIETKCLSWDRKFNIYTTQFFQYKKLKLPIIVILGIEEIVPILKILINKPDIKKGIHIYNKIYNKFDKYILKDRNEVNKFLFGEHFNEQRKKQKTL